MSSSNSTHLIRPNSLCHADCLALLERMDEGVVQSVYLDPPWFSHPSLPIHGTSSAVANGLREYLDNFARVLQQCHRVLTEDGSIVVHAEPHLGQKFALLLAQIFRENHVDDYILPHFGPRQGTRHAALLHYGKSLNTLVNDIRRQVVTSQHDANPDSDPRGPWHPVELTISVERPAFRYEWRGIQPPSGHSWRYQRSELDRLADDGRIQFGLQFPRLKAYLAEREGVPVGTVWDDLRPIGPADGEQLGYISQQPVALIERVILRTSNRGDLILDPYCGSGTSLIAAYRQGRQWIGCDSLGEAIGLTRTRLSSEGLAEGGDWTTYSTADLAAVEAKPIFLRRVLTMFEDLNAAELLVAEGENQFVEWKVSAYWNASAGRKDEQNKKKFVRAVAAFLNSRDGGTVLIGVSDDGTLPGLVDDYEAANRQRPGRDTYELWLRQTLGDRLGKEFNSFVRIMFEDLDGKDVCIVRIAAGNRPACNGDTLPIRRGNQTIDLPLRDALEHARTRWTL